MGRTFLVRHGKAEKFGLTEEGRKEAALAGEELAAQGLGATALLLSSESPRAVKTSEVIAQRLGISKVLASEYLFQAGTEPEIVQNLDRVLQASLARLGHVQESTDLIVVTHMPLISVARFQDRYELTENGEVWEYPQGSWVNTDYNPNNGETIVFEEDLGLR